MLGDVEKRWTLVFAKERKVDGNAEALAVKNARDVLREVSLEFPWDFEQQTEGSSGYVLGLLCFSRNARFHKRYIQHTATR